MASSVPKQSTPLVLVCGEDDFAVKQRAKQIYLQWTEELGGMDHEIIDAAVSHSGEALKSLAKLREDLFQQRLKHNTNQIENTMVIRSTRRDIARVSTVLAEKSRSAAVAVAKEK